MPDREKVMLGLTKCGRVHRSLEDCAECPYKLKPGHYAGMECWCRLCDDALALLKEQEARWIPVTERLPEHTRPAVLAVVKSLNGRRFVDTLYYLTWLGVWSDADDEAQMIGDEGDVVFYWMPLPEPPKEEDDDGR